MSNFKQFGDAVRRQFVAMSDGPLFVVDSDRDAIWTQYLAAFPAGSDPIFRKRTEHDCACCRSFIRNVGNVVTVQNGALVSVWDLNALPHPYQTVADGMSAYTKSLPVRDVFLTNAACYGAALSRELIDGHTHQWDHFAVDVPRKCMDHDYVAKRGKQRTTFQVLMRGLTELTPEAVETVADLIRSNAIYRGAEHQRAVEAFRALQSRVLSAVDPRARDLLVWTMIDAPVARFRNTVIGTLVQDIAAGTDLEDAVRSFETKVAPQNYKRPTALITKGMVQQAMKTIQELNLERALERRHARLSDVSVNSVLFVDNAVRGKMRDGIEGLLMSEVKLAPFDPKKAEEISIEAFIATVLPRTNAIRLYLDNSLQRNFVSMTAPVHAEPKPLFRWDNNFAWSYDGNVTDSIKDRVKRAGGRVENVAMRVSLAWYNTDDLDLHVFEPDGNHIYFGNKSTRLDVDMNVGHTTLVRDAVENVRWVSRPRAGQYRVFVHNYTRREAVDVGFTVEIESPNGIDTLRFEKGIPARAEQPVAMIQVAPSGAVTVGVHKDMVVGSSSQEKWGLNTLDLVRVNSIVLSPNCWDGRDIGNKHWFFILDGCRNPDPARGIYNEFLHPRLERHRKVFEVLGDKTKCPSVGDQLSGVGFSSTRKDRVTVIAMGPNLNKTYTIVF